MTELRNPQRVEIPQGLKRTTISSKFDFDRSKIPPGWSYEFKKASIYGQEDRQYHLSLLRNHWRPVPGSRHPELVGSGAGDHPIIIEGLMLMERPEYLTEEAKREDFVKGQGQMEQQFARLDQIDAIDPRQGFEQSRSTINRTFERGAVPDDTPKG